MSGMIDLHSHSTASDGSMTPAELAAYAAGKGLAAFALTDHDTIEGIEEALEAGKRCGIEVIPGIETTTVAEGCDVHIVGLFFNPMSPGIKSQAAQMAKSRDDRNRSMVQQLEKAGVDIHWSDFLKWEGRSIAKAHVAEILIERGYASNLKEAITKYMAKGTVGYVRRRTPEPAEVVDVMHQAGGLAIIAHINQIDRKNWDHGEAVCRSIIEVGADGLETLYSEYDEVWRDRAEALRREYGLLASGGSDFHGSFKPGLDLGCGYGELAVPIQFLNEMKKKLKIEELSQNRGSSLP
jgi:predicted metal-dependent phosphoesterase TrpH